MAQFNSPLLDALAAKSLLKLANEAKAGSAEGLHVDLPSPARVAQESLLLLFGHSEHNHSTRGMYTPPHSHSHTRQTNTVITLSHTPDKHRYHTLTHPDTLSHSHTRQTNTVITLSLFDPINITLYLPPPPHTHPYHSRSLSLFDPITP